MLMLSSPPAFLEIVKSFFDILSTGIKKLLIAGRPDEKIAFKLPKYYCFEDILGYF